MKFEDLHPPGTWAATWFDERASKRPHWGVDCNLPDILGIAYIGNGYGRPGEAEAIARAVAALPDLVAATRSFLEADSHDGVQLAWDMARRALERVDTPLTDGGESLLRAVRENPDNDKPRLDYADWLEERHGRAPCHRCGGSGTVLISSEGHGAAGRAVTGKCGTRKGEGTVKSGSAARAEFIRVQCHLAAVERGIEEQEGLVGAASVTAEELRNRERGLFILLHGGGDAFLETDITAYSVEGIRVRYRRGFIHVAEGDWEDLRDHLPALLASPHAALERVETTWPPASWTDQFVPAGQDPSHYRQKKVVERLLSEQFPSPRPIQWVLRGRECGRCDGLGRVEVRSRGEYGWEELELACGACGGSGNQPRDERGDG